MKTLHANSIENPDNKTGAEVFDELGGGDMDALLEPYFCDERIAEAIEKDEKINWICVREVGDRAYGGSLAWFGSDPIQDGFSCSDR